MFDDDFDTYHTTTLLRPQSQHEPTSLEKSRIMHVLSYLSSHPTSHISDSADTQQFHNIVCEVCKMSSDDVSKYDILKSKIDGCKSNECLLLHAAKAYGLQPKSLLMDTIAIHSRIKKLEHQDAWFDNFSLNSFLLQLTTIVYDAYDNGSDMFVKSVAMIPEMNMSGGGMKDDMTTRNEMMRWMICSKSSNTSLTGGQTSSRCGPNYDVKPTIVPSVKLSNPIALLHHLGNEYRCFVEFGLTSESVNDDKAVEMLDKLNSKYPYYTGCTHGCDVFTPMFSEKSVSISDISEYCARYPLSIVGYILNTKTYKSGRGQHWVALLFKFKTCYLICSQAGGFDMFEEKSLVNDLNKCGFAKQWNSNCIQHDGSSCGMYSVLANLCFILDGCGNREPSISRVVEMIGSDGKGINNKGVYEIKRKLAGYVSE